MLTNLFRSAVEHDKLPEVLATLTALLDEWIDHWNRLAEAADPISGVASRWLKRAQSTRSMLVRMERAAA